MSKKGQAKPLWSRVQRARERFNAKADHYVRLHEKAAEKAAEKGDDGPIRWALEHIAILDPDGAEMRPISPSIDRKVIEEGHTGPIVNIGIALPGLPAVKVIDVTPAAGLLSPPIDVIVNTNQAGLPPLDMGAKVEVSQSGRNLEDCPAIKPESDNSPNVPLRGN